MIQPHGKVCPAGFDTVNINKTNLLRCPHDQGELLCVGSAEGTQSLTCAICNVAFPVVNGIPRFVESDGYSVNFGFQWNNFRKTQLDSHAGITLSKDRFYQQSHWDPANLKGKTVLDVGCGAGRFTEIALDAGAIVYAVDYSNAVEACHANHSHRQNLNVIQADIYRLPLLQNSFDFVYCFGVLQHTPDVQNAFFQLPNFVRSGGKLCVDLYLQKWHRRFHPKRLLRPITTRLKKETLFKVLQRTVPILLRLNQLLRLVPVIGDRLTRFVPVADYTGLYGLNKQQLQEWALLDTFDWLAPAYDSPQTPNVLKRWMYTAELDEIEVEVPGFVVGRAKKK